jgi:hypothetical protein
VFDVVRRADPIGGPEQGRGFVPVAALEQHSGKLGIEPDRLAIAPGFHGKASPKPMARRFLCANRDTASRASLIDPALAAIAAMETEIRIDRKAPFATQCDAASKGRPCAPCNPLIARA